MARWSITRRLIGFLAIGLGTLWLIAVSASLLTVRHEIDEVFDSALQETGQRLLQLASLQLAEDPANLRAVGGEPARFAEHDEYILYQILSPSGEILIRSHDAPREPLSGLEAAGFSDIEGYRLYSLTTVDGALTIHVAEDTEERNELILESLVWLVTPLLALLPLASLLVWGAARRAARPLANVQREIGVRDGLNLTPVPDQDLPRELAPLVQDVNRLLERLEHTLQAERSLAANSAHELRTPIADAVVQAEGLLSFITDENARKRGLRLHDALKRLSRLVEKLLQLSRAEAGIGFSAEAMDAMPVIELVVDERARRVDAGGRIVFDRSGRTSFPLKADVDALGIALGNLIENAMVHGDPSLPVKISLPDPGHIRVVNAGPAVPRDRLEALRRPFERGRESGPGTGLGLAIVETIMGQSEGRLTLTSPAQGRDDGFQADLFFEVP
ncbi:MAG: sensor histidine kinase N-terminal domain-containing protein [Limibacillus sp.]